MKSIIFIDAKNSCTCTLVTNSDNGTNAVYLQIDSDTSLNPKLNIESVSGYDAQIITISESPYIYKIPAQYFTASTVFKFKITDDMHTCDMFSVAFPIVITGNTVLRKIDNFNYAISCSQKSVNGLPIATTERVGVVKVGATMNINDDGTLNVNDAVGSEVLQLANDYTDSKTEVLRWRPQSNANFDELQLRLSGSTGSQGLSIVSYKDGSALDFANLYDHNGHFLPDFPVSIYSINTYGFSSGSTVANGSTITKTGRIPAIPSGYSHALLVGRSSYCCMSAYSISGTTLSVTMLNISGGTHTLGLYVTLIVYKNRW